MPQSPLHRQRPEQNKLRQFTSHGSWAAESDVIASTGERLRMELLPRPNQSTELIRVGCCQRIGVLGKAHKYSGDRAVDDAGNNHAHAEAHLHKHMGKY